MSRGGMRRASLGTILFTVFLDLLGFGLVVPYLPGVAREYGASDLVAALLGASYSLMQLVFVPVWGALSDRVGRRPVLVVSILASALSMVGLGLSSALWMLFAARIFSGIATANIAVAQAYIADVTEPEARSRGMGLIGVGIGLGFVLGPVIGGLLETHSPPGRPGSLPAFAAAALSGVNVLLALFFVPESLRREDRGRSVRSASPLNLDRFRVAFAVRGVPLAMLLNLVAVLSFAGLEQTFRLFTQDAFAMSAKETGYVLGFSGVVLLFAQGALLRPLSRRASERRLILAGLVIEALGFFVVALSPGAGAGILWLFAGMGTIALGSGLTNPSVSAFVSRCGSAQNQGALLGVLQSAGALGRVVGPAFGGLIYEVVGPSAPYAAAGIGMVLAAAMSLRLGSPSGGEEAAGAAGESAARSLH